MSSASCLCGLVKIEVELARLKFTACHCSMCRKWGGTWMAVETRSAPQIENESAVVSYPSSAWASRGFCGRCGTHLFYRVDRDDQYFIPVGIFDDENNFEFKRQIYIDAKPDYYCFADETLNVPSAMLETAPPRDD